MTEISVRSDLATTIAFRVLRTLEVSGFVQKLEGSKLYVSTVGETGAPPLAGALQLLRHISEAPPEGLNEQQQLYSSSMSLPQIQSALADLEHARLVEEKESGCWSVSPGILGYAQGLLKGDPTLLALRPIMQSLSDETSETITWFRTVDQKQTIADLIPSTNAIRYQLPVGSIHPLFKGAAGKAWLAALPEDELPDLLHTIITEADCGDEISIEALLTSLSEVRAVGYAVSKHERVENAAAVAVAVRGPRGELAGVLGIMAPDFRMPPSTATYLGEKLTLLTDGLFDNKAIVQSIIKVADGK